MDYIARAKQSLSFGLSVVLVFTLNPGVGTGMAYQSAAPSPRRRHGLRVFRTGRARDRQ